MFLLVWCGEWVGTGPTPSGGANLGSWVLRQGSSRAREPVEIQGVEAGSPCKRIRSATKMSVAEKTGSGSSRTSRNGPCPARIGGTCNTCGQQVQWMNRQFYPGTAPGSDSVLASLLKRPPCYRNSSHAAKKPKCFIPVCFVLKHIVSRTHSSLRNRLHLKW